MKDRIRQLIAKVNDLEGQALVETLVELCALLWEDRDIVQLREHTSTLGRVARADRNQWGLAKAHYFEGLSYYFTGNYDRALEDQFSALRAFEKLNNRHDAALVQKEIGSCYSRTEQYDAAIRYMQQSLDTFAELKDERHYAYQLNNMANVYTNSGNFMRAIECYHETIEVSRRTNDAFGQAIGLLNLGELYLEQQDYTQALQYNEQSRTLFESLNHRFGLSLNNYNTGKVYHRLGDYQTALRYLGQSLQIAEELGFAENRRDVCRWIATVYRDMGEWEQALRFYREYNTHRNSMFNEQTGRKIAALETQWRLELHEKEAEVHRLKNEELERTIQELETATRKLEDTQRRMVQMEQKNVAMAVAMEACDAIHKPLTKLGVCCTQLQAELPEENTGAQQRIQRMAASIERIGQLLTRIRNVDVKMKKLYSENTRMFDIYTQAQERTDG